MLVLFMVKIKKKMPKISKVKPKRITLQELEEMKEYNELDILFKVIEISGSIKDITEKTIKGNKTAGVDTRKHIQDLRMLLEIMRNKIQYRKDGLEEDENSKLFRAIEKEKKRLLEEEERFKLLEEKRKKRMDEKRQNR